MNPKDFTLVIGDKNKSSWSFRPWLLMKYFEIPFDEIMIKLDQPNTKENILKWNPAAKVPVLLHQSWKIGDSLAICETLAEIFPHKKMWPTDWRDRARARALCAEMHSGFQSMRQELPFKAVSQGPIRKNFSPEALRDVAMLNERLEERLREQESGGFLFGEFSIADAFFAPVTFRLTGYDVSSTERVKEYCRKIQNLNAVKEWISGAEGEM